MTEKEGPFPLVISNVPMRDLKQPGHRRNQTDDHSFFPNPPRFPVPQLAGTLALPVADSFAPMVLRSALVKDTP